MSDQPTPETPERDSFRRLAEDAMLELARGVVHDDTYAALYDRFAALTHVDDSLPVFHIRPVWLVLNGETVWSEQKTREEAERIARADEAWFIGKSAIRKEWRWGIHGANGEPILPESETLKNRVDALEQAHRLADPLGARVLDDEGHEV